MTKRLLSSLAVMIATSYLTMAPAAKADTVYTGSVVLPSAVPLRQMAVGATGDLYIAGASTVKQAVSSAPSLIANGGTKQVYIDALSNTVGITSVAPVWLFTSTVNGAVTTAGAINNAFSTITGKQAPNTTVSTREAINFTATFPTATQGNVNGFPLLTTTLTPGHYGNVTAILNSTIHLTAGTYYFDQLNTVLGGTLDVDTSAGPVTLYVAQALNHLGEQRGTASKFLLVYFGSQDAFLKGSFSGAVYAPNGTLWMGHLPFGQLTGTFYGKSLQLFPGTYVQHVASTVVGMPPIASAGLPHAGQKGLDDLLPGYNGPGGAAACPPAFQMTGQTTNAAGEAAWTTLTPATSLPAGCAPKYCDANDNPLPTPTAQALNVKATGACPPVGGSSDDLECGVDPSTVTTVCNSDTDCASGSVCGAVCNDQDCLGTTKKCGKLFKSCAGIAAEATNCQDNVLWECPDIDTVGVTQRAGDGGVDQQLPEHHSLDATGVPTLKYVLPPVAVPSCDNADINITPPQAVAEGTVQPTAKAEDATGSLQGASASAQDNMTARLVDQGSKKWGVYVSPTSGTFHNFSPKKFLGEGTFEIGGTYGLAAGVRVFGHEINVIGAEARAVVANCGMAVGAVLKVFGEAIPLFDKSAVNPLTAGATDKDKEKACLDKYKGLDDEASQLRKALFAAENLTKVYKNNGLSPTVCNDANLLLASTGSPYDCSDPHNTGVISETTSQDIVRQVLSDYDAHIDQSTSFKTDLDLKKNQVAFEANFKLFDINPKPYTETLFISVFPLGPITINIAVEGYGQYGFGGSLGAALSYQGQLLQGQLELPSNSNTGDVRAFGGPTVTPYLGIGASAFAGVGAAGVSVGIEGRINLFTLKLPVTARAGLGRVRTADPRSFASTYPGTPKPGFEPYTYQWKPGYSIGAQAVLSMMDGQINLAARINWVLFKKTWRKKLVSWKGFSHTYNIYSKSSTDTSALSLPPSDPAANTGTTGDDVAYPQLTLPPAPQGANPQDRKNLPQPLLGDTDCSIIVI